jgi:hypothetical protein
VGPYNQRIGFDIYKTYPNTPFTVPIYVPGSNGSVETGSTISDAVTENYPFYASYTPDGAASTADLYGQWIFDNDDKLFLKRVRLSSWVYAIGGFIRPTNYDRVREFDTMATIWALWDNGAGPSAASKEGMTCYTSLHLNEWQDINRWLPRPSGTQPGASRGIWLTYSQQKTFSVIFNNTPNQSQGQGFAITFEAEIAHHKPMVSSA